MTHTSKDRFVAFLFLAAGIAGFVLALKHHSVPIGLLALSLLMCGMWIARDTRKFLIEQKRMAAARANLIKARDKLLDFEDPIKTDRSE